MPPRPVPRAARGARWLLRALLPALAAAAWLGPRPAAAQDEVPFVVTPDAVTQAMLELAGVRSSDRLIDLGSGDGRIVITAAKRHGARGLGVEIVPDLVAKSRRNAEAAGVAALTEFRVQDLFETDLAGASVVTMYLLPAVNLQLRPRLLALAPGTRIVSHDWDLGDWVPDRTVTVEVPDKPFGLDKTSRVHLWVVPLQLAGRWCAGPQVLALEQRFRHFSGSLQVQGQAAPIAVFDGLVTASEGLIEAGRTGIGGTLVLRGDRLDQLELLQATGTLGLAGGQRFGRC